MNLREEIGNKGKAFPVKPFNVYNAGLYDFDKLKELAWDQYIDFCKWRILNHVLLSKDDHIPNFLNNLVSTIHFDEIPIQSLRGHIFYDFRGENPLPSFINSYSVQICSKDLHREILRML